MIGRILERLRSRFTSASRAGSVFMSENPHYSNYKIGRYTYGRPEVYAKHEAALTIGSFCSFASGVKIVLGGEHRADWVTTYPFNIMFSDAANYHGHPSSKGAITIGHDVWVGQDVSIFSGVNIGDGAVIAARSVVRRNVAPYSIAGGNPARHLGYRFDATTISALQSIAWWDWPLEKIKEAWPLLLASDVNAFIAEYKNR